MCLVTHLFALNGLIGFICHLCSKGSFWLLYKNSHNTIKCNFLKSGFRNQHKGNTRAGQKSAQEAPSARDASRPICQQNTHGANSDLASKLKPQVDGERSASEQVFTLVLLCQVCPSKVTSGKYGDQSEEHSLNVCKGTRSEVRQGSPSHTPHHRAFAVAAPELGSWAARGLSEFLVGL